MRGFHFVWLFIAIVVASNCPAQDEDDLPMAPGLSASYYRSAGEQPAFQRRDAIPALSIDRGAVVDARLPETGWQVRWTGVLRVFRPGKYRFGAKTSGQLNAVVLGRPVLSTSGGDSLQLGDEIELPFGFHDVEFSFSATRSPVRLRLYWESEHFPIEPLPPFMIGHRPDEQPPRDQFEAGRLAVEEHNCVACHRANDSVPISNVLARHPGPVLTDAGRRLKRAWIYHWLGNPQKFRRDATMPRLFSEDEQGELERYAVAVFLSSLGGAIEREEQPAEALGQGERLFNSIGCTACHSSADDAMEYLPQKTTRDRVAEFLRAPQSVMPSGRMPGMDLTVEESQQIAVYLTSREAEELPMPDRPEMNEQDLVELGRRVMRERRCTACHELRIPGEETFWEPSPAQNDFSQIVKTPSGGCLDGSDGAAATPRFSKLLERDSVVEFLRSAASASAERSPTRHARAALKRLKCLVCHERNGKGGLSPPMLTELMKHQTADNAEMVSPPPLTNVADKLLPDEIRRVLLDGHRSRPWMSLRMPRYARHAVEPLIEGLAKLDGAATNAEPLRTTVDKQLAETGRQLAGTGGFGCVKCHDLLGTPSRGFRGPDLAKVPSRINFGWYRRWMHDPQRIKPRTRMPTLFRNGQSTLVEILDGDPERQTLALWHYFLDAANLPLPDGTLEDAAVLTDATTRPRIIRTFLPDTTARAVAVQFPSQVHVAWDAQTCRAAYAWQGGFLDMKPVWTGRGGQPAGLLGERIWNGPAGFPWAVTEDDETIPDFSVRANDTRLGALQIVPPEGEDVVDDIEFFEGDEQLDFRGYSLRGAAPTFQYDLVLSDGRRVNFSETLETVARDDSIGIVRDVQVWGPPENYLWWHVAAADEPPEWFSAQGNSGTLDSPEKRVSATTVLRLRQEEKNVVIRLRAFPEDAVWLSVPQGNAFAVVMLARVRSEPEKFSLAVLDCEKPDAAISAELRR